MLQFELQSKWIAQEFIWHSITNSQYYGTVKELSYFIVLKDRIYTLYVSGLC